MQRYTMEDNVRVVDRVFDILELLSIESSPVGISHISRMTGMSKSTVHRLVNSMYARSYVARTKDGRYFLGYKIVELAGTHIDNLELVTEAKPFLSQISRELKLNAHLGILDKAEVVYIEKMDVHPNIQKYTQIGQRSPAYCSSMGKCLLSGLSQSELKEVLEYIELKRYTKKTITDQAELIKELREVRRRGWAIDDGEYQENHRCIGATIYDFRGVPIAAISASGSADSLTGEILDRTVTAVCSAAREISLRMGYIV